jgi:hypothetical protein
VEVSFEARAGGTLITLKHRGWITVVIPAVRRRRALLAVTGS